LPSQPFFLESVLFYSRLLASPTASGFLVFLCAPPIFIYDYSAFSFPTKIGPHLPFGKMAKKLSFSLSPSHRGSSLFPPNPGPFPRLYRESSFFYCRTSILLLPNDAQTGSFPNATCIPYWRRSVPRTAMAGGILFLGSHTGLDRSKAFPPLSHMLTWSFHLGSLSLPFYVRLRQDPPMPWRRLLS